MKAEKQVLTASAEHSRENTCTGVSILINIVKPIFIQNEALAQVLSW